MEAAMASMKASAADFHARYPTFPDGGSGDSAMASDIDNVLSQVCKANHSVSVVAVPCTSFPILFPLWFSLSLPTESRDRRPEFDHQD